MIRSGFVFAICSILPWPILLMPLVASSSVLFCLTKSITPTGLCPNFTKVPIYVGCKTTILLDF